MASQAARGKKALDASDYETAIKEYTAAIKESPTSPDYYIQRSTAHLRKKQFDEALADAEQGLLNAYERAKKESIVEGQFRRAIVLWQLGRYADAAFCLDLVKKGKPDHKAADMWIMKSKSAIANLPEDAEGRKCTVKEKPLASAAKHELSSSSATNGSTPTPAPSASQPVSAPLQTPIDKIRHEWYQNTENIYFTLLAKGVPKDKAEVDITERSLSISFPLATGASYDLTLEPLFAPIIPEKCITRIMPSKTEIILIKATPGQKWSSLESKETIEVKPEPGTSGDVEDDGVKRAVFADTKPSGPAYPTSSKNGPKDWDKLADDFRKEDAKGKNSGIPGDDDDDEGDEANAFFRKLYKAGNPDMQRAMMKSFQESNGTSLSTNWDEVSKGPVETLPPDGMEAKKWNS